MDDEDSPLIGSSLHALRAQLRALAGSSSPLLLCGESGTGKSIAARWVHVLARPKEPFVTVNCAGFPDTLVDSQLFGHERGAFTGADARSPGRFAEAGSGTIFLDEIGDMPIQQQSKLLHVIETRRARRLGSTDEHAIHARVIAATNIDLEEAVREKRFREDLLYRLGLPLRIPSLAERPEDIPEIVASILPRLEKAPILSDGAIDWLAAQEWPGNVRELRMLLERAALLADGQPVDARFLGGLRASASRTTTLAQPLDAACRTLEERLARHAFQRRRGNLSAAARDLQVSRNYLAKLLGRE